jgi:hypothetical protein
MTNFHTDSLCITIRGSRVNIILENECRSQYKNNTENWQIQRLRRSQWKKTVSKWEFHNLRTYFLFPVCMVPEIVASVYTLY